jgi:hypothetical protein
MKTKVLFAVAFFLSTATFAQQVDAKTSQSGSASLTSNPSASTVNISSNSSTSLKTNALSSAEQKANQAKEDAKKTVSKTRETAQKNVNADASIKATESVNASSRNNKVSQDASINGKSELAETNKNLDEKSGKSMTEVRDAGKDVKASASIGSSAAAKTSTEIKQTSKPRPATIKMQGQMNSTAGIKIK